MPVIIHEPDFPRLPPEELAAWAKIPTTIIVDDTDGAAFVDPDIRALPQGVAFAGQAITVEAPPADISAVHYALPMGWPGVDKRVVRAESPSTGSNALASPKSRMCGSPAASISTLPGLRSRWTTPCAWA